MYLIRIQNSCNMYKKKNEPENVFIKISKQCPVTLKKIYFKYEICTSDMLTIVYPWYVQLFSHYISKLVNHNKT